MTLLLASCTEDFKDWAEPQSNPQGQVITFGNGSVNPVGVIDLAEVPDSVEMIKVCDITAPATSDTAYAPVYTIYLNGQEFPLNVDGTMSVADLESYVISLFGKAPEPRVLTAQVKCVMTNGTTAITIMSDPFEITVIPEPATMPDLWYLVGSCIGDGSWSNVLDNVGTSLIPMYTEAEDFSVLTYVGYFPAGQGFKLIHIPGNWDEQWGMKDGAFVKNDGGSGNIEVSADGYYMVTYDMNTETLTVEPYDENPGVYAQIAMPGGYQGWNPGENPMTPMSTVVENHDWMAVMTFEENTELKFAAEGGWTVNWGSNTFPVGVATNNGPNIPVEMGTYRIVFNDILGRYYFIAQ